MVAGDDNDRAVAIFPSALVDRTHIAGARLRSTGSFAKKVTDGLLAGKVMAKAAIPGQYPLLRTMQLTLLGYHRRRH